MAQIPGAYGLKNFAKRGCPFRDFKLIVSGHPHPALLEISVIFYLISTDPPGKRRLQLTS